MPDGATLLVFAAASLAITAFPGPSVLYIVTRSLEHGRAAGLLAMLGVEAGAAVHVAAAALGLSALLASSAVAFALVKYAGAAYLVLLGIRALRRPVVDPHKMPPAASRRRLFGQGLTVNLLNPKTAMFLLAFMPQFVDAAAGAVAVQLGVLGVVFVVVAAVSDTAYVVLAGSVGQYLRRSSRVHRALDRFSGGVYLLLGASAALTGDRPRG